MTGWDEHMATHVSPTGKTHSGPREICISVDCLPPSVPSRDGDLVHVILPDGTEHDWVIESDGKGRTTLSPPPKTEKATKSVAPWMRETMRKQGIRHVAREIDLIDADDPERAHGQLDEALLRVAPDEVREAALRLMARCDWWAGA